VTCPFEVNDGAYILGALGPAERADFEHHLATCPTCRESVAQLAVLPGLLGRLDPATVRPTATAPHGLLPRVLEQARARGRSQRRRQLLTTAGAALAAAAVTAALGVGAQWYGRPDAVATVVHSDSPEEVFLQMQPAADEAFSALISVTDTEIGTQVAVRCRYDGTSQESWPIWLVVYPRDPNAAAEAIGSWLAKPGEQIDVTATTLYAPEDIQRIELQGYENATLAWWSP
jgi:hypothetical protein